MLWFNRKKEEQAAVTKAVGIEIVAEKRARKEVVVQALEINKQLTNLLQDNHFTVKILLAAGGSTKKRVIKNGH